MVFLRALPDACADLIIADPPYSLAKDREFGDGASSTPRDEWLVWCKLWLTEAKRILKPRGTCSSTPSTTTPASFRRNSMMLGLHYPGVNYHWHYENWVVPSTVMAPPATTSPILWFAHGNDSTFSRDPRAVQERGTATPHDHKNGEGMDAAILMAVRRATSWAVSDPGRPALCEGAD
jgi:hypothetical protein